MAIAQSMQDRPPPSASRKQDRPAGDLATGGGGGYDEDAALAQAIAQSLQEQDKKVSTERMASCCVRRGYSQMYVHLHASIIWLSYNHLSSII